MRKLCNLVLFLIFCFALSILPVVSAAEDYWMKMADVPIETEGSRAAVVNGKIYVIGNSFTYEYDPETNTWASKTPMPTARSGFGVAVYQNKIYVIGGIRAFLEFDFGANEVYDPVTDTWENRTPNPTARSSFQANVVNGKIYLIGGAIPGGANYYLHAVALNEVYDPATDSWSKMEPMPKAVKGYASAVLDDKIYIMGGQVGDYPIPNGTKNHVQVFDPKTNQWSMASPLPISVKYAAGVATTGVFALKRIYVFGGDANNEAYRNSSRYHTYDIGPTNATQVYDPLTNRWSFATSMFSARYSLVAANVDDTLYVIGGKTPDDLNYPKTTYANDKYTPIGFGAPDPSYVPPDTITPEVSIISPQNETSSKPDLPLIFTVNESPSWIRYKLDDEIVVEVEGNSTLNGLSAGLHNLTVYATDVSGNTGVSETIYFTIDSSAPVISVLTPGNITYNSTEVPLNFKVNEEVTRMSYSLDGQETTPITGNTTLTGLPSGYHNITFYAEDQAGNVGASTTTTFTVAELEYPLTILIVVVLGASVTIAAALLLYFKKKKNNSRHFKKTTLL